MKLRCGMSTLKNEPKFTITGKPDDKKITRLLIELYCKQEGYEILELEFNSDAKEETA